MRAQGFTVTRIDSERGIALITTLLVMMLMSALLVGFTTVVMSDQRYRLIDRDRVRSFYAAHSGLEKLNVDLGNLFLANVAPTAAQIAALKDTPPTIADVTFIDSGDAAYGVKLESTPAPSPISTGPYQGLVALKKIYRLDATARTADGGETHLMRRVETVTIPVFQFGVFSDVDLSFHAGPNFNFGGRVHSNRDLYLAQGAGATLTLPERVTTVRDVIRKTLANGEAITTTGHTGTVSLATAPGAFRNLLETEGSVQNGAGSAANPNWPTVSLSTYNGYIRNTTTGARRLDLPLLTTGGANSDLIKRGLPNEDVTNPDLLQSRYYNNVSLRILLSDTAGDIMSLPTVTGIQPVPLNNEWRTVPPNNGTAYGPVDATHNPIAESPGRIPGNPTITNAVATGAAQAVAITNFPTSFRIPTAAAGHYLRVSKSGINYTVTCSGKTASTFTGCVTAPTPGAAITGATITSVLTDNSTATVNSHATTTWAAPWTTITVAAGNNTNAFTANLMAVTVRKGVNVYRALCSGKTATQFIGCVADPTAPNGVPGAAVSLPGVTAEVTIPTFTEGNQTIVENLTANWASPWSTLTMATTTRFSTNTFYAMNTPALNGTDVLVTCTGFQLGVVLPHAVTGCNVTTALVAGATVESGALGDANTGLIGGFIKIERQDANKVWHDVTMEILNYGISGPNLAGRICDPSPNAIVRLQRLRDNAETGAGACSYQGTLAASDFVPNILFDTREAVYRDAGPGDNRLFLGGVMHYVSINVANLSAWFNGAGAYAAGTGPQSLKDNGGFSIYFSDRRNNRNASNQETGDFGFEDIINPLSATGTPNNTLDVGEDANGNGTLDTYGNFPNFDGVYNTSFANAVAPMTNAARLNTLVRRAHAVSNRALFFRRALKLANGGLGNIVMPGLTIAAENAVYIHGSWNANASAVGQGALGEPNAATSIAADSVTLLSDNWNDVNSVTSPYAIGARARSANSYFRLAIIAGKNQAFPWPSAGAPPTDFGTDGGMHNFLRMLESGGSVHYRGSIATFFYSRQAVGVYKCCTTVYGAPVRNFAFDTDFLDPALLPPLTPMFRDTNSLGFAQEVRPGK